MGSKRSLRPQTFHRDLIHSGTGEYWPWKRRSFSNSPPILSKVNKVFSTQDKEDFIVYAYSKPIDVDSIIWVKNRMRILEVQGQMKDRVSLFDEFYVDTPMTDLI